MEIKPIPSHPSLEQYRKQAKDLLNAHKSAAPAALDRLRVWHPAFASGSPDETATRPLLLTGAQLVIAREHGFESWPEFEGHIEAVTSRRKELLANDPSAVFLEAACIPMGDLHNSGNLEAAQSLLARNPEIAHASIYTAAALGDDAAVRGFLAVDPESAIRKGGPHEWDALTCLCFSRYLRLDRARSAGFVRAATALLNAGASANTGWYEANDEPRPLWESAIYGAAGIARNVELTRLLLDRGADPNDGETPYHVAETYDNAVMEVMVESGKFNDESMTTLLLRKADWHDYQGMKYLLEHGSDPNRATRWGNTAFQHALGRDNSLDHIRLMLDHGADPLLVNAHTGIPGASMAARRGRGDVLHQLEDRGIAFQFQGVDRLIAACARAEDESLRRIIEAEPALLTEVFAQGGTLLGKFAGNGNTEGVRILLDLGVSVSALYREGDGYFEIARDSTALHVAAWRARHETLKLLLARGANANALDRRGRTPLSLAIKACVDSYWKDRRSPDSIRALLLAGASREGIKIPTGYPEADALLIQN